MSESATPSSSGAVPNGEDGPTEASGAVPMKLCLLSPVGTIGGAERILLLAAEAFGRLRPDWSVSAILMEPGPLEAALKRVGVEVRVVPLPPTVAAFGDSALIGSGLLGRARGALRLALAAPAVLSYTRRLAREIRALGPTLVHSNGLKSHLLGSIAVGRHSPITWHLHDFLGSRPLMGRLVRGVRSRVRGATAISEAVAKDWRAAAPGLPVTTVLNGIDVERFAAAPSVDPTSLDELAGMPPVGPGTVRIGLIATYATWKGHDVFLEALGRVLPGEPAARGYLIGGPIYTSAGSQVSAARLEARIRELGLQGRVGLIPFQERPAEVLHRLDIVVHASTRPEPFGLTIAEAMAAGRAVVFARGGGADEVCRDGVEGLGHQAGDSADLARRIERLLAEPELRIRLGEAARSAARSRFSADRFGRDLLRFLEAAALPSPARS